VEQETEIRLGLRWVSRWVYPINPTEFFGYAPGCLNPAVCRNGFLQYVDSGGWATDRAFNL